MFILKQTKILLALTLFATLCVIQCAPVQQPALTPAAQQAWYSTQAIKALDAFRDIAIQAAAQNPPVVAPSTARRIVQYHEDTIKLIHASPAGWSAVVRISLPAFVQTLSAQEQTVVAPYVTLILTVLQEVQ